MSDWCTCDLDDAVKFVTGPHHNMACDFYPGNGELSDIQLTHQSVEDGERPPEYKGMSLTEINEFIANLGRIAIATFVVCVIFSLIF